MKIFKIAPLVLLLVVFTTACEKGETEANLNYYLTVKNPGQYDRAIINFEYARARISNNSVGETRSVDLPSQAYNFDLANVPEPAFMGSSPIEESTVIAYDLAFETSYLIEGNDTILLRDPSLGSTTVEVLFNVSDDASRDVTFELDLSASDSVTANGQHFFYPAFQVKVD